ncbi:helix-turn-helix transcriptional regulator [Dyadobacter arcticus]|uniref:AraC-like DNA-binding protein n=1 Tax=Dyadobacter arcticus TaxID=1078754 RepID=A0ABX0ULN4_9BACT|nr:AraC family transcriptional regulator [Dyadobacter arcticus]NIJ53812.1 AraC-like DNA-binding protein [Dyadobacter arcticus]
MTFEFTTKPGFNFLTSFSEQFGVPVTGDRLDIPEEMGSGSIRKVDINEHFKLLIHHYTFKEEFVLRRKAPEEITDLITIIFYSSTLPNNQLSNREKSFTCTKINSSSIEVSSNDLNSEIRFPADREIHFTVVGIKAALLAELLSLDEPSQLIRTVTNGSSTFLYHVAMSQDFEKTLRVIADNDKMSALKKMFYKVKVQELFYMLFDKLLKRDYKTECSLNNLDVSRLMVVRDFLLANLSEPPHLRDMAKLAHMSETKLKMLFRQVFGDSIYNYYQTARMNEAATMLKHSRVPVSEVGYQLGFSNLSHFSRLFAKHHGQTPKKFQSVG